MKNLRLDYVLSSWRSIVCFAALYSVSVSEESFAAMISCIEIVCRTFGKMEFSNADFGGILSEEGGSQIKDLILHHIAPGAGVVVALLMFMSPLNAVLRVRASGRLGEFNPLPLIAIIANCTCWLVYGCLKADAYVIAANVPGLMLGFFMSFSCYGFANAKVRVSCSDQELQGTTHHPSWHACMCDRPK